MRTGIYKGAEFYDWLKGFLAEKNIYTFADLKAGWKKPKFESRLQVIASDISSRQFSCCHATLRFSANAGTRSRWPRPCA